MSGRETGEPVVIGPAPTVGRMVHFNVSGGAGQPMKAVAAIVTEVLPLASMGAPWRVKLTLFPPDERPFPVKAPVEQGTAHGTWCWPPMIPLAQVAR